MNSVHYKNYLHSFYEQQTRIFKLFALWQLPKHTSERYRKFYKVYFWQFFIFWILLFNITLLTQFLSKIYELNEIIKVFSIFASCFAALIKFISVKSNSGLYQELLDNINRNMYRPQNPREMKLFIKSVHISRRIRNCYCLLSLSSLIFVVLSPFFVESSELPFSTYTPFNMDSKWQFGIMYLYESLAVAVGCLINISFDSIAVSFLLFVKCQLDILADRLENLGTQFEENDDDIHIQLRKLNLFYNELGKISEIVEHLVNVPFSIQVLCSVLVLIANFYAMSLVSFIFCYICICCFNFL